MLDLIVKAVSIRWMKCSPEQTFTENVLQLQKFSETSVTLKRRQIGFPLACRKRRWNLFLANKWLCPLAVIRADKISLSCERWWQSLLQSKSTFISHENTICNTPQQEAQEKEKKTLFGWWSHGSAVFKLQPTRETEKKKRRRHGVAIFLLLYYVLIEENFHHAPSSISVTYLCLEAGGGIFINVWLAEVLPW